MSGGADKRTVYERARLGERVGYGEHPALLVVDLQVGFTAPELSPVAGELGAVIAAANRLLGAARAAGAPAYFTVIAYDPQCPDDAGLWPRKGPYLRTLTVGGDLVRLDPRVERHPSDLLLVKKYASAFFGTHLAALLAARGIDTVMVTGCTTSGCVRATVVDALGYGFRPIVPREAVGDRADEPHEASLFDIDAKYGDVVSLEEALAYLARLRSVGRAAGDAAARGRVGEAAAPTAPGVKRASKS
ncbi:MAG: isochorismatase family protein [Deltaproteobacteria bacterium]|nr:isochorismatase family protein [Deltaproteobacteria bacterium]